MLLRELQKFPLFTLVRSTKKMKRTLVRYSHHLLVNGGGARVHGHIGGIHSPPFIKPISSSFPSVRFFSSTENPKSSTPSPTTEPTNTIDVQDVSNKDLKLRINKYFQDEDVNVLPSVFEAILQRALTKKHEDTDDELIEEFQFKPLDGVTDKEFEDDFEEMHDTDEEIDNLYNARDYVQKKMVQDEYFNMDDTKWDDMIKEATQQGFLKDTKECEEILEDMLRWDKLLPDVIKKKVGAKFNELGDMCERGELEPEDAYQLFSEFEDQMVVECAKIMDAEKPSPDEEMGVPDKNTELDDPPGEGPILRWTTRVVFAPGGDAWHPKNRKVKLAITVKELGLSKHAFRRLREVVGKRYNSGKDELTIISERYDHREENRKDCLRTLYSLIEDAVKADRLVEETRASYVQQRLRSNPEFMERLRAKTMKMKGSLP